MTQTYAKDLDAVHYRNHSRFQYESAKALLASHSFQPTDRLLDIGCGDGRITAELAEQLPQGGAVGVDLSASMIEYARSSFPSSTHPNLDYQVCNAEGLPFSNQFDVAISVNCLHWVVDKRKAFERIAAALVPGGSFLTLVATKDADFADLFGEISQDSRWSHYPRHEAFDKALFAEEYKELIESVGLNVQEYGLVKKEAIFHSKEDIAGFMKIWANYYLPLPEELQPVYLAEAVDYMIQSAPPSDDGWIHMPVSCLQLKATKVAG